MNTHPHRLLHTMLRVADLDVSIAFYTAGLGMKLLRREDFPDARFTLAFVGFESEESGAVVELTHNWDTQLYDLGSAFGHIAVAVAEIEGAFDSLINAGATPIRAPGPMAFTASSGAGPERVAFVSDPDGYWIELIERA